MKKLYIVITLILGVFIGGILSTEVLATQNNTIKIWFQNQNGSYSTLNIVDEKTGVNYIVVCDYRMTYSTPSEGIAMCPRYNADGSLYVSK